LATAFTLPLVTVAMAEFDDAHVASPAAPFGAIVALRVAESPAAIDKVGWSIVTPVTATSPPDDLHELKHKTARLKHRKRIFFVFMIKKIKLLVN